MKQIYFQMLDQMDVLESKEGTELESTSVDGVSVEHHEDLRVVCEDKETYLKDPENSEIYNVSMNPRKYPSYNFLMTNRWAILIPRSKERSHDMSVNSLGFLKSLFVKSEEQLESLKSLGCMRLLKTVTFPQEKK
eukprot:gb/GECH01013576.1/.p1 GENE.gb/GECH01013576.1/~~gb/GECH01013576.1/.p1  ORF type:complete len:135 (+),score=34.31 gb/GECH01013576.1/:1-405(+)